MKVKKFRLKPRLPTVGKILKALLSVKQLPAELEQSLPAESESFLEHVQPAAFYQTWGKGEVPAAFTEILKKAGITKPVAVTALVATIGQAPEERLSQLLMSGETQSAQVVTAFAEEAADLSMNFILRLLADDANGDGCVISEPVLINDTSLLAETLTLLEAAQDGVTVDTAEHLSPRFTRVAIAGWAPISRKRPSTTTAKKKAA
ncbi:MAG: hypothetical protein JST16_06950 [Bdellovibrionales bacterium]|nr:hypothetical protein [Bdellovibrionales bacterium]